MKIYEKKLIFYKIFAFTPYNSHQYFTPEKSLDFSNPCAICTRCQIQPKPSRPAIPVKTFRIRVIFIYFPKIFYIRLVDGGGNSDKVNFIISELVFLLLWLKRLLFFKGYVYEK